MKPSFYIGGKYPNSPMRHRNEDKQTLRDYVEKLGYIVAENPIDADIYLSADYNDDNEKVLRAREIAGRFNVLFRNEPRCVLPAGYSKRAIDLNNHIVTFGKPHKDSTSEVWPQFLNENSLIHESHERDNLSAVIVNANKLNLSRGELYTLRRECIANLNRVKIYGEDWNTSKKARIKVVLIEIFKSPIKHLLTFSFHSKYWFAQRPLIVAPEDKNEVLLKYKVSLVIENEMTYLSEKLFDALFAGCIPVYVGPEICDYEIPRSLVFQAEPNLHSIENQINRAMQADYSTFRQELAYWLNSSEVKARHQGENVMTRAIEKCIQEYFRFVNLNRK